MEGSKNHSSVPSETVCTSDRAGKYLIFHLGAEEFGAEVLKVREIMGLQDITPVPKVPAHVKGVINLRGKVIPVIDLGVKFGMPAQDYTSRTCIVVTRTVRGDEDVLVGMVVDGVAEVLTLSEDDIQDTPRFGPGISTPYLIGMAKMKGKVKILMDIDQVLNNDDLCAMTALLQ
jgi:purine-binding chemotaxis protein CheW